MSRGSVRRGEALLPGLFRCARCGRKLNVYYGGEAQRYVCAGAFSHMAAALCISFGGLRVDRAIAKEVLDRLQPIGVEAALCAIEARGQQRSEKQRQLEFALQQARYDASRAQHQYDAIDPDNRLVADELERRWNERLIAVRDLEAEIDLLGANTGQHLSNDDKRRLMSLGEDLARAWDSTAATPETRKKIIRTVISEIVVDVVYDSVEMVIHWEGGDHTKMVVKKNRVGQTRWCNDAEVIDLVRALSRHMPDETIAAVLNRSGKLTGHGNTWTRTRVCSIRRQKDIAIYRPGEREERGELTLDEAAAKLNVSPSTVRRLISSGVLPATQVCKGAPWVIHTIDLDRDDVRSHADARRMRRPPPDTSQQNLLTL